jgi:hypothetical protein
MLVLLVVIVFLESVVRVLFAQPMTNFGQARKLPALDVDMPIGPRPGITKANVYD